MTPSANDESRTTTAADSVPFREAVAFWWRLGFISFGGPAGQIATMFTELVERRRWISERRFMHALNYCMVLPGPEAQQLATYIGWLLHGTRGGIVAGTFFILPSLVLLLALSALYVSYGQLPAVAAILNGIKPAVVAIIAAAAWRIGSRTITNWVLLMFAIAAWVGQSLLRIPFPYVILAAGVCGWLGSRIWPDKFLVTRHAPRRSGEASAVTAVLDDHHQLPQHAQWNARRATLQAITGLLLWLVPLAALLLIDRWHGTLTRMALFFTSAALLTFGGAYAVLPYVAHQAVEVSDWLTAAEMIDGLALGESTPGPLIMIVTYVGFLGGWRTSSWGWWGGIAGGLVATYFTFLPSFLFILIGAPWIERMRGELRLTAALSGITAAVVGVIVDLAFLFGKTVFWKNGFALGSGDPRSALQSIDGVAVAVAIVSLVALIRYKVNLLQVLAAAAGIGWVRYLLSAA